MNSLKMFKKANDFQLHAMNKATVTLQGLMSTGELSDDMADSIAVKIKNFYENNLDKNKLYFCTELEKLLIHELQLGVSPFQINNRTA